MSRKDKLGKQLQKDLGAIIDAASKQLLQNVMVTVLDVEVTPDLGLAKVYLSFLNSKDKKADLKILEENAPTIRHYLAQQLKDHARKTPELKFYIDETIDKAERLEQLLQNLKNDSAE
ncbi:MAG: 30S ribosome-binding factor RbfA [Flavobacteriales bacterium]|nr:30S ribosome-binding factor RbfA [Flavobacteriales bacterium]